MLLQFLVNTISAPPPNGRGAKWWQTLVLLVVALMGYAPARAINCPNPVIHNVSQYYFPSKGHVSFQLKFFNYDGSNSGFTGPVFLMIDGKDMLQLDNVWGGIRRKSDESIKSSGHADRKKNILGTKYFSSGNYLGWVALSNLVEVDDKWMSVTVDLILERPFYNKSIKVGVSGTWSNHDNASSTKTVTCNYNYPSVPWPNLYVQRTGSKVAKFYATGLPAHKYPNKGGKGVEGTWQYCLRFSSVDNADKNWPTNLYTIKQYWDNKNSTPVTVNKNFVDCTTGASDVNMTLELDNYRAFRIYPYLIHYAPQYQCYPHNKDDALEGKVMFGRSYKEHWVYGYPRPNPSGQGNGSSSAAYAMRTEVNAWTTAVTVSWYPQIDNASHVNTDGKWIVFRKKTGESGCGAKIGEAAYQKGKTSFVDKEAKNYGQQYTYTVAFQPTEWKKEITSDSDVPGLSYYVRAMVEPKNPLTKLAPSNDKEGKIEVTCSFNNFQDAGNSNKYTLSLYRRVQGTASWGSVYQTADIDDPEVLSHVFVDNNVANSCTNYEYMVSVAAQGTTFKIGDKGGMLGCSQGNTNVTSLVASRGDFNGTVRLTWNVDQQGTSATYFNVQRRLLGSDAEFQTIYTTSGTAAVYSYDDNTAQPGSYYDYRVQCYRTCEGASTPTYGIYQQTDGFALATGVVSGRVAYGTGTAVEGVKVSVTPNGADGGVKRSFFGLKKPDNAPGYVGVKRSIDQLKELCAKPWTVQMYFKYNGIPASMATSDHKYMNLFSLGGYHNGVRLDENGAIYAFVVNYIRADGVLGTTQLGKSLSNVKENYILQPGKFYNIAYGFDGNDTYSLRIIDENGNMRKYTTTGIAYSGRLPTIQAYELDEGIWFGSVYAYLPHCEAVYDECRFWTKCLTDDELMKNYNHTLSGSEDGLYIYYKFDEGLDHGIAYDYSRTGGVANGNHGHIENMVMTDDVPEDDLLSIGAVTDINGNYTISGIPFSGDGVSYTVHPTYGTHEFTPIKTNRYVSAQSLVHNGVDFEDVSSFSVSGYVYYKGTTVPVEGVQFAVDGVSCTKDGKFITTDENGRYTISVPIGSHYISASKQGHTFADVDGSSMDGKAYYPAQIEGSTKMETAEFVADIPQLIFFDTTLVPIVGRVSGGAVENGKPLGLGQSVNNIGRATITLQAGESYQLNATPVITGSAVSFEPAATERVFDVPDGASDCNSTTVAGAGKMDNTQIITITTDSLTGEFAAMVPPLTYKVNSVRVNTNSSVAFEGGDLIDASNPTALFADSAEVDGEWRKFDYVASYKKNYRSPSILSVTQRKAKAPGLFGMESVPVTATDGSKGDVTLYDTACPVELPFAEHKPLYTFGYPVFAQDATYDFDLHLYEQYVNNDKGAPVDSTIVSLGGTVVTVRNELGTGTSVIVGGDSDGQVYESSETELELDEDGRATYHWRAGLPNILDDFTRTMTMTYNIDGTELSWNKDAFKGIILGDLTSGNNFVTGGPDEVAMILRDPAGTGSSAYVEEGQSVTKSVMRGGQVLSENSVITNTKLGLKNTVITGTALGGLVATSVETECKLQLTVGVNISEEVNMGTTNTRTVTTTKRISTSDTPDFVGAVGDVFVGTATNYIFGAARQVGIHKTTAADTPQLGRKDVMTVGTSFGTEFLYSQNYVENTLLPNFEKLRDSCLVHVNSYTDIQYSPNDKPLYITTLNRGDEGYGSNNSDTEVWGSNAAPRGAVEGPSYKMVFPQSAYEGGKLKDSYGVGDTIAWFNAQISAWRQVLANNEKAKVEAIKNRDKFLRNNYSFDAGASVSTSTATTTSKDFTVESNTSIVFVGGLAKGFSINQAGVDLEVTTRTGGAVTTSDGSTEEQAMEVGFSLVEDGDDDALSIDVLDAPDGFGPIFYTRGGQTSCPYEDEQRTQYYQPGRHVLATKTMQIEQPSITAKETVKTGVPSGKPATFTVYLQNTSETDEDCWFNLNVVDESNPDGAAVQVDGENITKGRTILVPAGATLTKTVQIRQTNPDVFEYRNLQLRISSVCQPDNTGTFPEIADTVELSAFFQQTGSEVSLKIEETTLNLRQGAFLNFTIADYDRNSVGLQCVRLQGKLDGDPQWTNVMEWVVDPDEVDHNRNKYQLPAEGHFSDFLYMDNAQIYPDGQWKFRAVTVSNFGGSEVTNSSDIIDVYKDMAVPQLISTPSPANGVLTADGEISLTFNEDIRGSLLTPADNFTLTGELNDATVAHDVALSLTGGEGAKTEAAYTLANRSFAVNMWVRYAAPGELFAHGTTTNNMKVAVNANDKLAVTIGGNSYVSENALKRNTWLFLSVSYDAESKALTAHYAYDASSVVLFNRVAVGDYTGTGAIVLGKGLTGMMHDVSLWDNARSWTEAQSGMYERKSRYSRGLMGYWRLNEGRGGTSADVARSRTLVLPSATAWYTAGTNYALKLDGNVAAFKTAGICSAYDESYMTEMWFRAEPDQAGRASIYGFFQENMFDVALDEAGQPVVTIGPNEYKANTADLRDNQWHHLAFSVLKATAGTATLYIDGKAVKQIDAEEVPPFATVFIVLGGRSTDTVFAQPFKGAVDEIRIWKGQRTADVIADYMYKRVPKYADGLVAYYPFEADTVDATLQPVVVETFEDRSGQDGECRVGLLQGTGELETVSVGTPALAKAKAMQNVSFSYVTSERKILIKLTDKPERIENCTVNVTVKGVRDTHNNMSDNVTWNVYVRQNQLLWQSKEIELGKFGTERVAFEVGIANNSGSAENWTVSGLPAWLTLNSESGMLPAVSERKLKFEIDPALNVGYYEATVYLTGSLGIAEPLVIRVNSTNEKPEWSVNPSDYEFSMNINGQLNVSGEYSQDVNDIVAAFRGTACVGVAKPVYFPRYDAYYVLMNVYGNRDDNGQPLTYKVYDASSGKVYPMVDVSLPDVLTFVPDKVTGTMAAPNVWKTTNKIEQTFSLAQGWQWLSFYVVPDSQSGETLLGDIRDHVTTMVGENGQWTSTSNSIVEVGAGEMYKLRMESPTAFSVVGLPVDVTATPVSIKPKWNWIGYMAPGYISLNEAFAELAPQDGDVVKSQTAFATWNQFEWVGTLNAMQAGEGYQYFSSRSAAQSFHYPSVSASDATASRRPVKGISAVAGEEMREIAAQYAGNMSVIARVIDHSGVVRGDAVVTVVDAEGSLRAKSGAAVADRHFVTVAGEGSGERLRFIVTVDGMDYTVPGTLSYMDDAIVGTFDEPLVIDLGSPTGIGSVTADETGAEPTFNLAGQRAHDKDRRQVVIRGGRKLVNGSK